jgi:hemerythrin
MINFTPDLLTGVSAIDEQHKELINRINAVVSMGTKSVSKEEIEETLNMLSDYVKKHFNDEETLQRKSGYPKYDTHRQLHQQYISEIQRLKSEYVKNGPTVQITLQINKSIIEWIVKHIKNVDVELGKFLKSKVGSTNLS